MHRTYLTWRSALLAFILLALLSPIGAGARSLSCDDFADPAAAQHLLDLDDSHAEDLDPDGDGIACNEDAEDVGDPLSGEDYVYAIWDEVEIQVDSAETFLSELNRVFDDATSDDERTGIIEDANATARSWTEYPETAPQFETPAGYEDIDEGYQAWIASLAAVGESWQAYWDTPGGSDEEEEAIDAFQAAVSAFGGASDDLIILLADAEADFLGSTGTGDAGRISLPAAMAPVVDRA